MGDSNLMSSTDFSQMEKPMVMVFPMLDALLAFGEVQTGGFALRLDNVILV